MQMGSGAAHTQLRDAAEVGVAQLQVELIIESQQLTLTDGDAEACTAATILQAFDQLRKQVALRVAGSEGVFAGYDTVEILLASSLPSDRLCLVGWVLGQPAPRHHKVRYTAYAVLDAQSPGIQSTYLLIAHAIGTTVMPCESRG